MPKKIVPWGTRTGKGREWDPLFDRPLTPLSVSSWAHPDHHHPLLPVLQLPQACLTKFWSWIKVWRQECSSTTSGLHRRGPVAQTSQTARHLPETLKCVTTHTPNPSEQPGETSPNGYTGCLQEDNWAIAPPSDTSVYHLGGLQSKGQGRASTVQKGKLSHSKELRKGTQGTQLCANTLALLTVHQGSPISR